MASLSPLENISLYGSSYGNQSYPSLPLGNNKKADATTPFGEEKKTNTDPSGECQTCKNRKYIDGSNEMVSFKSPTHIAPENAASAVRSHEQEHVTNAYSRAATNNGKVVRASVTIHTDICPECGRSYVSGGTTDTQIKYYNEENPYQQDLKATDQIKYKGMNTDYAI